MQKVKDFGGGDSSGFGAESRGTQMHRNETGIDGKRSLLRRKISLRPDHHDNIIRTPGLQNLPHGTPHSLSLKTICNQLKGRRTFAGSYELLDRKSTRLNSSHQV